MLDIGYWLTSKQRGVRSLTRTGDDYSGMIRSQSSANHVRIPALVLIAGAGGVDGARVSYQDSLGLLCPNGPLSNTDDIQPNDTYKQSDLAPEA